MSWFERLEQACAAFVERTFALSFPSDLEPAQIARKLVAVMEAHTRGDEGQLLAPGSYEVRMNAGDFARLESHRAYLEGQWGELLREMGARVGIAYDGAARVEMTAGENVPRGAVDIVIAGETALSEPAGSTPSAQRSARRYRLRVVKGVPAEAVFVLPAGAQTGIGRGDDCEVTLRDPAVSRTHARIEMEGDRPLLRDRDSTNGTFVNGKRVERIRLHAGDIVKVGNTQLRLEACDDV